MFNPPYPDVPIDSSQEIHVRHLDIVAQIVNKTISPDAVGDFLVEMVEYGPTRGWAERLLGRLVAAGVFAERHTAEAKHVWQEALILIGYWTVEAELQENASVGFRELLNTHWGEEDGFTTRIFRFVRDGINVQVQFNPNIDMTGLGYVASVDIDRHVLFTKRVPNQPTKTYQKRLVNAYLELWRQALEHLLRSTLGKTFNCLVSEWMHRPEHVSVHFDPVSASNRLQLAWRKHAGEFSYWKYIIGEASVEDIVNWYLWVQGWLWENGWPPLSFQSAEGSS